MASEPQQNPEEAPAEDTKSFGCSFYVLVLVGAPLLYVLSLGPMARYYQTRNAPKPVEAFYAPIVFLGNNATPVRRFLLWYVDSLWLRRPPPNVRTTAPPTSGSPTNSPPAGH